jgi:hypothetical protein
MYSRKAILKTYIIGTKLKIFVYHLRVDMRLININTFRLETFVEPSIPEYAILSHTWDGEEVVYEEFIKASKNVVEKDARYHKIRGCAELAAEADLSNFWIDTCCIDKSSSAELQEAINSMYRWYQNSEVCFVYLGDQLSTTMLSIKSCRWITRGWTLQELIAPYVVQFYDSDWNLVGNKRDHGFLQMLSEHTGVETEILRDGDLNSACVAQKLSWASRRQCTLIEDTAYSLMGLFNVNIPMLYGEGNKAFIRLQEEIIKSTFDMSIFAWEDKSAGSDTFSGLLAKSPKYFNSSKALYKLNSLGNLSPYSMTNLGLNLKATLQDVTDQNRNRFLLRLDNIKMNSSSQTDEKDLAIYLEKLPSGANQYIRVECHKFVRWAMTTNEENKTDIYIHQHPILPRSRLSPRAMSFWISSILIRTDTSIKENFLLAGQILRVWPASDWVPNKNMIKIHTKKYIKIAVVWYGDKKIRAICLILRSSGEHQIAIVHNIDIKTNETQIQEMVIKALDDASGSFVSAVASTYESSEISEDFKVNISAEMEPRLIKEEIVLAVSVYETHTSIK